MSDKQPSNLPVRPSHHQEAPQDSSFPDPVISRALFTKAANQNHRLTRLERLLILSRCDLPGKALARPEAITEAERNLILRRPPPDMLAANIREVTGGAMSTIAELEADHAESLHFLALSAVVANYWTKETRLFNVHTNEFHGEANRAAMNMLSRPSERALQREALKRMSDPALQPKLLAAAGPVDPVSGRLIVKKDTMSSQERETIQRGRYTELLHAKRILRKEIEDQVEAELKALSEGEVKELQELRDRMVLERDQEIKEDAYEAERRASERKKEDEELLEKERRKRRRRKAARRQGAAAEGDDGEIESDDSEKGRFPTSEDTW